MPCVRKTAPTREDTHIHTSEYYTCICIIVKYDSLHQALLAMEYHNSASHKCQGFCLLGVGVARGWVFLRKRKQQHIGNREVL